MKSSLWLILLSFVCLLTQAAYPPPAQAAKKAVTLKIGTKGDQLQFNKATLKAPAGAQVKLTFKNNSTGLQHNFVLTKPGAADAVANAGIVAGTAKDYIPESPDVIAHTKLLNAGQSETIRFTAPSTPGDYQFLCTFPGHSTTMKGTFKVTP